MKKKNKTSGLLTRGLLLGVVIVFCAFYISRDAQSVKEGKPNIVIILSDDQGYADVSYHEHPSEISTPAIDKLASEGVVFTNGYASAYVCAPTRAGLLTGRYQQRFGFYRASDSRQGLPLSEKTLAEYLKEEGYVTGVFGKWHLGLTKPYHPCSRGFDKFYGFLGHGGHDYFDLTCQDNPDGWHQCIYRDFEKISDKGYLTDNLAREACRFIEESAKLDNPFFLYLPFNAVHWPLQAPEADIEKYNTGNGDRDVMLAMLYRMDIAVEKVYQKLKETDSYENTLLFYFSDNGGAKKIHANNKPLRDYKQSTYEGGIRVPFIVSWPKSIKPQIIDEPVISLDILPTILDAIDKDLPGDRIFDGKSMMPIFQGTLEHPLHNELVWDGDEGRWAIREGNYKLVMSRSGDIELYDLLDDIGESTNIKSIQPSIARKLENKYHKWRSQMAEPMNRKNR